MPLSADQVFVLAGAGASFAPPAELPVFAAVRDEILSQLGLNEYIPSRARNTVQTRTAERLAPEPFMLALDRAGVPVESWVKRVVARGAPNAVHHALAQLCQAGAAVWTVNYDTLIEDAGGLEECAWPSEPRRGTFVYKPHGSITGRLILTAEQVLRPLSGEWLELLREMVNDRVVAFIGYSGKDLDFRPIWDEVLQGALRVLWFGATSEEDRQFRAGILPSLPVGKKLFFPPKFGARDTNPSRHFIDWCADKGLVARDSALWPQLSVPPSYSWPSLGGPTALARGAVYEVFGDIQNARLNYLLAALLRPRPAFQRWVNVELNHGSRNVARALAPARALPSWQHLKEVRSMALLKRASILFNIGAHEAVLRATAPSEGAPSTLLILRSGAVRITGDLDEAADLGNRGLSRALAEQHNVRVANAALQLSMALMWAGRLAEARSVVDNQLGPYGSIAANRWVAWAAYMRAALAIHEGRAEAAKAAIQESNEAEERFAAEGLLDGVMDALMVRLAAFRLDGDDDAYLACRHALIVRQRDGRGGTHYARRHEFTREALALEDVEFTRCHQQEPVTAREMLNLNPPRSFRLGLMICNAGARAACGSSFVCFRRAFG